MVLEIEYRPELPSTLHQSREEFEADARMAMAVKLFEMKRVSSGIAAQLAGLPRAHFLLALHRFGVPMMDLDEEELQSDLANAWPRPARHQYRTAQRTRRRTRRSGNLARAFSKREQPGSPLLPRIERTCFIVLTTTFVGILTAAEALPLEERWMLEELLRRRRIEHWRRETAAEGKKRNAPFVPANSKVSPSRHSDAAPGRHFVSARPCPHFAI